MAIDDLHSGAAHHHYDALLEKVEITEGGKVALVVIVLVTFIFAAVAVTKLLKEERDSHNLRINPLPQSEQMSRKSR
jgi:hypothetical protein